MKVFYSEYNMCIFFLQNFICLQSITHTPVALQAHYDFNIALVHVSLTPHQQSGVYRVAAHFQAGKRVPGSPPSSGPALFCRDPTQNDGV